MVTSALKMSESNLYATSPIKNIYKGTNNLRKNMKSIETICFVVL